MSALLWFIVWAVLIFLMMRFGCGAHVMGHRRGGTRHGKIGYMRWVPPETDTDPVCGKTVSTASAKSSVFGGFVYYFCSRECRELFEAAPRLYTGGHAPSGHRKLESQHG